MQCKRCKFFDPCPAVSKLKKDAMCCFIVSNVRDKKTGFYRNLVNTTTQAFDSCGYGLYNDLVLLMDHLEQYHDRQCPFFEPIPEPKPKSKEQHAPARREWELEAENRVLRREIESLKRRLEKGVK